MPASVLHYLYQIATSPDERMVCIAAVNPVRVGGWGLGADLIDRTFGNLVGKCRMEKERRNRGREKAIPIDVEEGNDRVGQSNVFL